VKATIHWVSAKHAVRREVRLYDRLFTVPKPEGDKEGRDFTEFLNPESLTVLKNCYLEPSLADVTPGVNYQFERLGYFIVDPVSSKNGEQVFNRTVTLRDTWAKVKGK
jgi:glutaminyl-tRNA synthetase